MNRYETFVIRFWIEDQSVFDHGEIRHLSSGRSVRFQLVSDAVKFMEKHIADGARTDRAERPPMDR